MKYLITVEFEVEADAPGLAKAKVKEVCEIGAGDWAPVVVKVLDLPEEEEVEK